MQTNPAVEQSKIIKWSQSLNFLQFAAKQMPWLHAEIAIVVIVHIAYSLTWTLDKWVVS